MPKDIDKSVEELQALVQIPGALRFITCRHACGPQYREGPNYQPGTEEEKAACEAFEYPQTDWRHFVIQDIVSIEGPDHTGRMTAHTGEGSFRRGRPYALLKALREAREV